MLTVKLQGELRRFPSRRNLKNMVDLIVNAVRKYSDGEDFKPPCIVFNADAATLFETEQGRWNVFYNSCPQFFILYGEFEGLHGHLRSEWRSCVRVPTKREIHNELAQALASLADEEREFIVAYYQRNVSQKQRKRFQRKGRRQRRNDGN